MKDHTHRLIPELNEIYALANNHPDIIKVEILSTIDTKHGKFSIPSIIIGSSDKSLPTLGLFGGVHGVERIGTQVLLAYLNTLNKRLDWDEDFKEQLKSRRIVCIPIVNPWGLAHFRRSNHNGVDLMRNAPVEADNATFLAGGHRYTNKIPWFRGDPNKLEVEAKTLIDFVKKEMFGASVSVALDFHSGFGIKDQIWYPYAKTKKPFPYLDRFKKLASLFEQTYPHHVYKIEAQTLHYTTHGDLWDYALDLHETIENKNTFIPLTLELGSWNWVKKNPLQIFSLFGMHNPVKKHRYSRQMRRHIYLIDFLLRSLKNNKSWDKE